MKLFSKDDARDLVILFSVPSAGILFSLLHKLVSWIANGDYHPPCGRGRPEGTQCEFDFLDLAVDLLDAWADAVTVAVIPLLTVVIVLVILVRWVRSLRISAQKH